MVTAVIHEFGTSTDVLIPNGSKIAIQCDFNTTVTLNYKQGINGTYAVQQTFVGPFNFLSAAVTADTNARIDSSGPDIVAWNVGTAPVIVIGAKGFRTRSQATPTAKTVSATLTAAEIAPLIITVNQGAAGASALQLPLATAMDTAFPEMIANDAFDLALINTSVTAAETASLTTNTGWTLVGAMDVPAYSAAGSLNSSGIFRARKTAAGAWILYRIG